MSYKKQSTKKKVSRYFLLSVLFPCLHIFFPPNAYAYIGPGAGFAFLGSTFVFVLTALLFIVTILFWPLQLIIRKVRGKGIPKNARARRVVIVGLDGLEPKLVDRYLAEGILPNFSHILESGSYLRLKTTLPALSPVAWSTFQTGVNPGSHNIFDFLTRDKRHCLPLMSSTKTVESRSEIKIGPFKIKRQKAAVTILRKSKPFWKLLGDRGIFSNIIRVPISYPPEPFNGNVLSAMCTPDLLGSQGTFSYFTYGDDKKNGPATVMTGGERGRLIKQGERYLGQIKGPKVESKILEVEFQLEVITPTLAKLTIGDTAVDLSLNCFSEWTELKFCFGRKTVSGIARFCIRSIEPNISLYVSPININPESPALPIGHPILFPTWIAKNQGLYGTLGLMEDTWGRNELVLDDRRFLEQTYLTHDEREKMFFEVLQRTREGLCVCVFDASDRIQHMFWRYLDNNHPSAKEGPEFSETIKEMYKRMDELVGRVKEKISKDDVLIVMSDHGFSSFRRGVNLNRWLLNEGYLVLKDGAEPSSDYFEGVDWDKTKAFAVGLTGIYINRKGRETRGFVNDQEAEVIKKEISAKLEAIRDPKDQAVAIRRMYDSKKEYKGLYTNEAPDLIVGYEPGYRVSWESITGGIEPEVFSDNTKAWSGDHHVDPEAVPGILITNKPVKVVDPHISEIAPTVLDLFAVDVPGYMDGRVLF